MKKITTIVCIIFGVFLLVETYGQDDKKQESKKESYKSLKLRSSVNEASRLLREADDLKKVDPAKALNKVEEALGMSIAQEDEFHEAKCYVLLGEINEAIEEWNLARENYSKAYQLLMGSYSASSEYKRTLQGLGDANLKLRNHDESLKYFEEALASGGRRNDQNELRLDISEVYYQMGKYTEALSAVDAISFGKAVDESMETRVQNQKAKIYARTNEFDKSRASFDNSLNTLRSNKSEDPQGAQSLQKAKEEIADELREQKRYDEEIDIRNQAIEYNLESKNLSEVTKDKVAIGKTLEKKGETSAALREVEEAATIADTLDDPKAKANAYLTLADMYEKNGRNTQALTAYKKFSIAVTESEKFNENQLLERSSLILRQKDIEEVMKNVSIGQREETIEQATVFRQQLVIYGLLLIILVIGVTSYFIYKNAKASKLANQLLALKSLRGQMNPHFIFNALNSVNHFIAQQDERTANKFLSEFSQLMRLVLENSQEDFIPLYKEQEILSLYLKLEHYRFRDKFDYDMEMDQDINTETIEVPPMLIQPYIENAVWHGLRYKETKGKLSLRFHKEPAALVVEISDNGIGREKSAVLKTENQKKHKSTGLKNIQERLAIINKVYKANYRVSVEDLAAGSGTCVRIYLPINNRMNGV